MGMDKELVMIHPILLSSPAIWSGGLEHSLDVILSLAATKVTSLARSSSTERSLNHKTTLAELLSPQVVIICYSVV